MRYRPEVSTRALLDLKETTVDRHRRTVQTLHAAAGNLRRCPADVNRIASAVQWAKWAVESHFHTLATLAACRDAQVVTL